jgi:outer membrane protein
MRKIISLIFIGFFGGTVLGQEVWTLEDCIIYATKNNLQVRQSELELEINEKQKTEAVGRFAPAVNANAYHQFNYGQTIDPYTNTFASDWVQSNNFSVGADWILFSGLRNVNNYKQSEYALKQAEESLENTKYDIALNVAGAYLQILFDRENLRIANAQAEITKEQVERTAKLVEAGTAPKANLLDVEAQLAQEELNIVDRENALSLSKLSLLQTLQLPGDSPIDVIAPDSIKPEALQLPPSPEVIIQSAYDNYPSLRVAEFQRLSAQSAFRNAQGAYSPTLALTGRLGTGYSGVRYQTDANGFPTTDVVPFGEQLDLNLNRTVGFNLSVPIFNRLGTSTMVGQAKIRMEQADVAIEQEKQRIRQTVEQAYADAKAAEKRYYSTEKSLKSLELSFEYAQKRFDVGAINAVDFNTAKTNLTRAQSQLVQAKYEYLFRITILEVYKGTFLETLTQ